ncbi:MAG TPA: hypothetical protein PLF50_01885 [Candidatus Cloacimonadota bacterium]|nr:hypothetical protein [Candidatus Cloacimonadota bacterium]
MEQFLVTYKPEGEKLWNYVTIKRVLGLCLDVAFLSFLIRMGEVQTAMDEQPHYLSTADMAYRSIKDN